MHTVHHRDLKTLLEVTRPASILLIDPHPDGLPTLAADCRVQRLDSAALLALHTSERFDLGVVANTLEHLEHKTAGVLLARLRDLHTRRFVALIPVGDRWEGYKSRWQTADILGYGMTIMARYRLDDKPLQLFHYCIDSYKATPAWFSNEHWAHPGHWRP